jgi:predicted dehydrogenase
MSKARRMWRYGLIGCGRFGRFCLQVLQRMDRVRPVAVADTAASLARTLAGDFGLQAYEDPRQLIQDTSVELVHVACPPASHYELALQAIRAGKHVLCEKPLAVDAHQSAHLVAEAQRHGVLLAVNHVLRYSPLLETAKRVIDSGLLGEPLHAVFENYAEDERLPADHWFWDPAISGGIFIEHGVHFFDLYRWWFGQGRVAWAATQHRPGTTQVDRACCAVQYENAVLGQFYHGFDQPYRLDRADHRVLLERGDIRIFGWVPMELRVHGIVDESGREKLSRLCDPAKMEVLEPYGPQQQACRSRGKDYRVTLRAQWTWQLPPEQRSQVYLALLEALFHDQLDAMENPDHQPRLTAQDAQQAVELAAEASRLAADEA